MTRIPLVDPQKAGLFARTVFSMVRRKIKKITGRAEVVDPIRITAHHPRLLWAYGQMEMGIEAAKSVPDRYKHLAMLRAAKMIECPF
jgi:hypothetical protein